jgi:hypothetical protein
MMPPQPQLGYAFSSRPTKQLSDAGASPAMQTKSESYNYGRDLKKSKERDPLRNRAQ